MNTVQLYSLYLVARGGSARDVQPKNHSLSMSADSAASALALPQTRFRAGVLRACAELVFNTRNAFESTASSAGQGCKRT